MTTISVGGFHQLWKEANGHWPGEFTISDANRIEWHRRWLARSEVETNVFAVRFHLKQLLTHSPDNPELSEKLRRLEIAEEQTNAVVQPAR